MVSGYLEYGIPTLILLLGLTLRVWDPAPVGDMRLRTFDYYQHIKPRTYVPLPVRIVDLDGESISRHGQWPWPRILLAQLLERLTEAGAAAIVFDILFSEPDRTSPLEIIKHLPEQLIDRNLEDKAAQFKSHDEVFSAAIRKAGNVALGFVLTPSGLECSRHCGLAKDLPVTTRAFSFHASRVPFSTCSPCLWRQPVAAG